MNELKTTEYGKIETLFERDANFKVIPDQLKNRTYSLLKTWHWTEKVDGTNIRCIYKDEKVTLGGKTDNAQIHADLINWLQVNVTAEKFSAIFPVENGISPEVVIYGEGFGAGIQKGGGDYSPIKKLIVFDVLIDNKWWLNYENVCDISAKMGLDVVPSFGEMAIEDAARVVLHGFKSKCAINPNKNAEGLVGRPLETLFDKKGHRLITKIKTKDF